MQIQRGALTMLEPALLIRQPTLTTRGSAMDCRKYSDGNLGYK